MKLENVRGTEDYGPKEQAVREKIIETIRDVFRLYGLQPMETPILEKFELLSAKYAGGDEILKETYTLEDQGGRELGLRYDNTVPLARYVAQNPTVKIPFKRYQIGPVFRDGPIKKGRLRQFYQADADIIGSDSMEADKTCIKIAGEVFKRLGIDVQIKVNSRQILDGIMKEAGVPEEKIPNAILSLDKLEKIGKKKVLDEMVTERGISSESAKKIFVNLDGLDQLFSIQEDLSDKLRWEKKLEKQFGSVEKIYGKKGLEDMRELFLSVNSKNLTFTPSLARGLAYYTGTIFEVYSEEFDSSLAAGGRYDDMIGKFARKDFPAVGISFGIEPIFQLMKEQVTYTKVLVIPVGVETDVASKLRSSGINTDVDITERGISKGLSYADYYNIPYCVIVGERELEKETFTLKDMESGEQEELTFEELVKKLS